MRALFWISLGFVFYVYLGYPLLLLVARLLRPRPVRKAHWEPMLSLVIAAHNEREHIEEKLLNCLSLDYPREKLEILISLDGPADGTQQIVRCYTSKGIRAVYSLVRIGKAAALNRAVAAARGEVIVFADARQRLDRWALRELVASLADPSVGAVSGELVLAEPGGEPGEEARHGIGVYWRYEKWIRALESGVHSVVGATGALYAVRRELFSPLPEETILDDVVVPLQVVRAGKRVLLERSARVYDSVASSPQAEFRRKVRTLAGNYQLLVLLPELLLPWKNPVFFQFLSHKVGRLLVPYFLLFAFLANLFLTEGIYALALMSQILWYGLAVGGALVFRRQAAGGGIFSRLLRLPHTFVLLNGAVIVALYHFLRQREELWKRLWTPYPVSHGHSIGHQH